MSSGPRFSRYSVFLFDADDTLFDFGAAETEAFARTLSAQAIEAVQIQELFPRYRAISRELWGLFELGRITQADLKIERFRRLFSAYGLSADPARAGAEYLENLSQGSHLIDGALDVCQALRARGARIGIVTNGFKRVQEPRIRASSLAPLVEYVVISEDFGVAKPDPRIFHHAVKTTASEPKAVLFVGDRLESDIRGAENAGLASCWFNPKREGNHSGVKPRYEIAGLRELLE